VVDGIDYVVDENVCEKTRESMGGGGTVMLFYYKRKRSGLRLSSSACLYIYNLVTYLLLLLCFCFNNLKYLISWKHRQPSAQRWRQISWGQSESRFCKASPCRQRRLQLLQSSCCCSKPLYSNCHCCF